MSTDHSEDKIVRISKTNLDLECSSPLFNKYSPASSKNAKQLRQNQNAINSCFYTEDELNCRRAKRIIYTVG